MKTKTLATIQTLSKIGKILSKIVYVCSIVGIVGCAVGSVAMLFGAKTIKLGGVTLHAILETEAGVGESTVWAAIVVGAILCTGEFFVARMAHRYFDNELQAGTPFTERGAKELLRLGISTVWIPIVAVVLGQVAQAVIAQFAENVEKLSLDGFDSVALGVMLIFSALLCRHGAEIGEKSEKKTEKEQAEKQA